MTNGVAEEVAGEGGAWNREVEQAGWRSPRCNDIDSNASY